MSEGPRPPIVIFGAGPYARLIRRLAEDAGRTVLAFVVDDAYRASEDFDDLPLLAWSRHRESPQFGECDHLVAVGYRSMRLRGRAADQIKAAGGRLATLVSPHARVARDAKIGEGTIIFPGCIVEHFVEIGANNVLWSGVIICHDATVASHNYFAPAVVVSGNCRIGDHCFFGTRSTLIDAVVVGDDCLIMAGATLCGEAEPCGVYAGLPAARKQEVDPAEGIRINR